MFLNIYKSGLQLDLSVFTILLTKSLRILLGGFPSQVLRKVPRFPKAESRAWILELLLKEIIYL